MRRALSTAGRRLSRCRTQGGVVGGGGVLLAARRDIPSSAQEGGGGGGARTALSPASLSYLLVGGGEWSRAMPTLPPSWAMGCATGWHVQSGFPTCIHEEKDGQPQSNPSSSSSSSLQSPRCLISSKAENTIVPTRRRGYSSSASQNGEESSGGSSATTSTTTATSSSSSSSSSHADGGKEADEERDEEPQSQSPSQSPRTTTEWTTTPEAENTWVDRVLPSSTVPYAKLVRLDRPIGTYLLAWPCFWSIALAAPAGAFPDPYLLSLFGAGSLLLRGAGCTVNDLWDRDIDKLVARTRNRPIASGAISPLNALVFLSGQLAAGLAILLQLNDFSKALGASSLALVAAYPLMKRVTDWPQAFLGLTFNWGALLGYAAVHGSLDPTVVLPLYASGVTWTLMYDTVYAHQDKEDDAKVGVRSTALLFGEDTKKYLAGFGAASVAGLCASGAAAGLTWPFYAGVGAAATHLTWQIADVDLDDRDDCAAKFKSNSVYGGIVFAAIVAGKLAG